MSRYNKEYTMKITFKTGRVIEAKTFRNFEETMAFLSEIGNSNFPFITFLEDGYMTDVKSIQEIECIKEEEV